MDATVATTVERAVDSAVDSTTTVATTSTTSTTVVPDEDVDINHIQVIGSHNSFHLIPQPVLFDGITAVSAELASGIEYSHRPLTEQLEDFGIRQFELDMFADPDGGLYANRVANSVVGLDPLAGEPLLDEPGFKVLHTQDFDYETNCLTLVLCLSEVNEWSLANPSHVPIMIMLEFKEQSVPDAAAEEGLVIDIDLPWTEPLAIDASLLDAFDAEIASVFSPDRLITPDDVRGDAATLEAAVLETGWPTLADSRGKILLTMTAEGAIRDLYTDGRASLEGRPVFTSSEPGRADAAFMRFDDPTEAGLTEAVLAGYLVRTRTDSPTDDARANNTVRRDDALASGANFLSTDYYEPSEFFDSDYVVRFADEVVARCNPVSAPVTCSPELLVES